MGDRRVARQQLLAAGKGKHDEAAAAEEESSGGDVQADFCFFAELLDLALTWLARVAPPALGALGAAAADDGGDAHGGSAPAALATVAALLRAASRASVYRARRDAAGVQWKVIDRAVDLAVPLARAACDAPSSAAAAPAVRRACADVLHALLLLESRAFRPHAPLALELAAMATTATDAAATDENDPLVALPLALLSVAAAERQMPATLEHLAARAAAPGGLGALQGLAPLWHSLARLVSVVPEAQAPELLPEVLDALESASAALPGEPRSAEARRASFWQLSCLASLVADSAPIVEPTAPAMRSIATRLASVVTSFAPPRHALESCAARSSRRRRCDSGLAAAAVRRHRLTRRRPPGRPRRVPPARLKRSASRSTCSSLPCSVTGRRRRSLTMWRRRRSTPTRRGSDFATSSAHCSRGRRQTCALLLAAVRGGRCCRRRSMRIRVVGR